jgi:hypothetical protein
VHDHGRIPAPGQPTWHPGARGSFETGNLVVEVRIEVGLATH